MEGAALEMRDPLSSLHRINMGPAHPAMHGIIRLILDLEGERVSDCEVELGYLHRGFEKHCEEGTYPQAIPYTDRLNYVSPFINNTGFCLAVEKLLGVSAPERCQYIRVILCELSRIVDHLTCIAAGAMETGAMTVFLYLMEAREAVYDLLDDVTGARVTVSFARIGGVRADLPEGFAEKTRQALRRVEKASRETEKLLFRNRIFVDRMSGTGMITAERAIGYGITGPFLRSTGCDYDVRKAFPYLVYDRLDFDIPIGRHGDNLDRYHVRMEEMIQSSRMIEQALRELPDASLEAAPAKILPAFQYADQAKRGRTGGLRSSRAAGDPTLEGSGRDRRPFILTPDKLVALPAKEEVYGNIEGLMNHFKLIMNGHGIRPPKGEVYFPVEGANGELGFYLVSDGTDRPSRVHCRPPCLAIMAALGEILRGELVADVVATFGTVNMIAGELER